MWGEPRFEDGPGPDGDELLPEVEFDPEAPPDEVPPVPEPLDPERTLLIEPVAESNADVPPGSLPVASFTVPARSPAASLTVPVTSPAASPTPFVRLDACPVKDVAVGTAEPSVSAGSSSTPARALPGSAPKESATKTRMRIAADVILIERYP